MKRLLAICLLATALAAAAQAYKINDFNNDGRSDLAVYYTATGQWFVLSLSPLRIVHYGFQWGGPTMVPVAGTITTTASRTSPSTTRQPGSGISSTRATP